MGTDKQVKVFVGASQSKVPLDVARALQALGDRAEYIQASGNSRNALDFHIAFYIGKLAREHPGASFHIVSKDAGFDPLIKHLSILKIECKRSATFGDVTAVVRISNSKPLTERVDAIVENLTKRKVWKATYVEDPRRQYQGPFRQQSHGRRGRQLGEAT